MCEVTTILLAASAAVGGVSAYQQSAAARDQANYQAGVERNNQTSANWAASDALERGARDEMQQRQKNRALKGEQATRLAANGLSLDSGAPLAILEDTDYFGEADALAVRDNARREAWGYREQGRNSGAAAAMYSTQARAQNPGLSAGLSLLGSAASVSSAWTKYGTSAAPKPKPIGVTNLQSWT